MKTSITHAADTIALFCRLQMVLKKGLPIRASEMGALIFVHQQEERVTPLMISNFFQIAKPSVTNIVNELVNNEYLNKEPSQDDRRSYYVVLTDKGNKLVEATHQEYFRMIELLKNDLGERDFSQFIDLLEKSNQILSRERLK